MKKSFFVLLLAANAYSYSNVSVSGSHTSITVESNGQTKTYQSDTPGSVSLQTDDGSAKAGASTGVSSVDITSPKPSPQFKKNKYISPSVTPAATITPVPSPNIPQPSIAPSHPGLISLIRSFFQKLFHFR